MKLIGLIVLVFMMSGAYAQRHTLLSRSELGFVAGGSYYIGDLNSYGHFKNTQPAVGLMYRFNIHSRLTLRANFTYGNVKASDAGSDKPVINNRNLSFASEIFEGAAGVEFHYFPFQIGHPRYKGTAYILAEIGLFHMNPTTDINGEQIELQSLGTEGQGTDLSSEGHYKKVQLAVPLGVGFKVSLGKSVAIGMEYGIRKTFTDYLDDVKAARYVNPDDLSAVSGPLAATLSNRSLDGSRFGRRGNPTTKDWYAFFGMTVTFKLGNPRKCPMMN